MRTAERTWQGRSVLIPSLWPPVSASTAGGSGQPQTAPGGRLALLCLTPPPCFS